MKLAIAACSLMLLSTVTIAKPNIVVVMTDDQDDRGSITLMPNVQALADEGVRFANSYTTNPLCAPARASFLTGEYPHNNGVWSNSLAYGTFKARAIDSLGPWLQAAGYDTAFIGKFMNGYNGPPSPGWNEWRVYTNGAHYVDYTLNENGADTQHHDYSTDYFSTKATEWVRSRGKKPFVLIVAPKAAHVESGINMPIPAPRHKGMFDTLALPRPPNFNEAHVEDKPGFIRRLSKLTDIWLVRKLYRKRMESLQSVDDMVASLRQTLADTGHALDTVIIYTSDNGFATGEHRWVGKHLIYEEQSHVPLIVFWPGMACAVRTDLVNTVDLTATILDIAGATPTTPIDGRSFTHLIRGKTPPWRTSLLIEGTIAKAGIVYSGIVTLTQTLAVSDSALYGHEVEYYDRERDPWELVSRPLSRAVAPLMAKLTTLMTCSGIGCWL